MQKICPTCGYQNPDDNDYCASCGSKFAPIPQSSNIVNPVVVTQVPPKDTSVPKEDDDVIR